MARSWNQYSEFVWKSHLGFRYRERLPSCYWQDPGPNLKGSAKTRILVNPRESCLQETRIRDCFITDIARILCKNILRASKKMLTILHRILTEKDALLGRIVAFQICWGSGKETLDILDTILVLLPAMILIDVRNESWQDPLSFFQKKILTCFRKILERILTDPDEILKTEIVRIWNKIVI